jgi:two-component system alkaline phosphatase synthesis response regulator PhoP
MPKAMACVLLLLPDFMKDRKPLRILTVEDEPAVTALLALILGGPAAKVTSACDGWMALMKVGAAKEPFDVIITDHHMPRVTGLELVRRLRKRGFAGKIIVLSAHLTKENARAYEDLKVDMMLAKPFDVGELQMAMDLLTKKSSPPVTAPMTAAA